MPPCASNLRHHIMRANYVAYIFQHADQLQMDFESPDGHGWDADGNVVWTSVTPRRLMRYLQPRIERIVLVPMMKNTRMIWMWKMKMLVNFKKRECKVCDQNVHACNIVHDITSIEWATGLFFLPR